MAARYAIIDLGTNTFHLLSVEMVGRDQWITLDRERVFVNLASDGIDQIGDGPFARGLATMERFRSRIAAKQITHIRAVGTAALRKASNAALFLDEVFERTGIRVEVIPGEREAELITKGVLFALPKMSRPVLIMDIGGGSVELIHAVGDQVLFSESFPVGVAVLYADYHKDEPISSENIASIDDHLGETFSGLIAHLAKYPDTVLVGASGTFEVVESILDPHRDPDIPPYSTAHPADFDGIYAEIVKLTLEERLVHPDIPDTRARYIVTAVHLIRYMLSLVSQDIFFISAYAMKEGLVVEASENAGAEV